ncbi:hypothetical protein [Moorena sp. SIO3I6]|uniref:hypothetical protein n=1 Tax=Moorena sp. SIO3I6 TaxID=2607831 RepID=UPI0013F99B83|nr:hypothetical protein [Moorena sp. SIO3I6]NEP22365.1 hypothetical protein [Moorena sp. SIO3I6]
MFTTIAVLKDLTPHLPKLPISRSPQLSISRSPQLPSSPHSPHFPHSLLPTPYSLLPISRR